jgi:GNAT acetyltransferase
VIRLSPAQYPAAHALYRSHGAAFPLIGAVLAGNQEGTVHADSAIDPAEVYVEHAFGFAQLFGAALPPFEEELRRHLLVEKAFSCPKVRLYTPAHPPFLAGDAGSALRSWRQHFRLREGWADTPPPLPQGVTLVDVGPAHTARIEAAFGVVSRFWRSERDFADHSNAVLALVKGQPAALCYAAAIADGRAEIDVVTLPGHRKLGLARTVVAMFSQRCLAQSLLPLWDCFTNNDASMALCKASGFVPLGEPYPFYTIPR